MKKYVFLVVEDGSGIPGVVALGISGVVNLGVTSVVTLGVPGEVYLLVPEHGIPSDIVYMLPGLVTLGSAISVPN